MELSSFALDDEPSHNNSLLHLCSLSHPNEQWQLHRACALGDVAAAEDLLRQGMDANKRDDYGYSPIHYACIADGSKLIELLKINEADVDAINFERKTALQIALEINNLQTAFCLISHMDVQFHRMYWNVETAAVIHCFT
jgi:ankyrin repeat protein